MVEKGTYSFWWFIRELYNFLWFRRNLLINHANFMKKVPICLVICMAVKICTSAGLQSICNKWTVLGPSVDNSKASAKETHVEWQRWWFSLYSYQSCSPFDYPEDWTYDSHKYSSLACCSYFKGRSCKIRTNGPAAPGNGFKCTSSSVWTACLRWFSLCSISGEENG
jgi:hypothetical protein